MGPLCIHGGTPEMKIQQLQQVGFLADYVSEFYALAADVRWSNETLISLFIRGLNSNILDLMVFVMLHFDVFGDWLKHNYQPLPKMKIQPQIHIKKHRSFICVHLWL